MILSYFTVANLETLHYADQCSSTIFPQSLAVRGPARNCGINKTLRKNLNILQNIYGISKNTMRISLKTQRLNGFQKGKF